MEIKNFSFTIADEVPIFDDLSLHFADNKVNVLVGENGVGKTTLLDLIASSRKGGGESTFLDFPRFGRIAFQLQGVPFIGQVTVRQTIKLMLEVAGESFVEQSLPQFIQKIMDRRFADLSGGQRRYVICYGVTLLDKDLYLFDEPESGLDPKMASVVMELIVELLKRKKHVIMTTHDFDNLNENHQLFLLADKRCVFSGSPREFAEEYPDKVAEYSQSV